MAKKDETAATPPSKDSATYVVLRADENGAWHQVGEQTAANAGSAIRAAASVSGEGEYQAVSSRMWRSTYVKTETQVRVVLSATKPEAEPEAQVDGPADTPA